MKKNGGEMRLELYYKRCYVCVQIEQEQYH